MKRTICLFVFVVLVRVCFCQDFEVDTSKFSCLEANKQASIDYYEKDKVVPLLMLNLDTLNDYEFFTLEQLLINKYLFNAESIEPDYSSIKMTNCYQSKMFSLCGGKEFFNSIVIESVNLCRKDLGFKYSYIRDYEEVDNVLKLNNLSMNRTKEYTEMYTVYLSVQKNSKLKLKYIFYNSKLSNNLILKKRVLKRIQKYITPATLNDKRIEDVLMINVFR